ncbi:MAG: hypothetical protein D6681_16050 [Calditrichaeota bacterium]|nr:MAG: hypothetical protein D6681_16050 [Calditrichota bacterium]
MQRGGKRLEGNRINLEQRRIRYLRDILPIRLGGLAANLSRIASFAQHDGHQEVVRSILKESRWFIEWTAAELETTRAAEPVRLQIQLAVWELQIESNWDDEAWRRQLVSGARQRSERLMEMSGLPESASDS